MKELIALLFQPPVLILVGLAVLGLSDLASKRSDYRLRINMEWRARESWMRDFSSNEELIERARQQFYERAGLKLPKRAK